MTKSRRLVFGGVAVLLIAIAAGIALSIDWFVPPRRADVPAPPAAAPVATAHITATLFYGSLDGEALVGLRREVPLAEGVEAQGVQILRAQLGPAPAPLVSVIPTGTALRAFYVTDRGEAVVDLSREVSTAHGGGTLTELLTVHAIVNAVTANLPRVRRVQLLIEGRPADTIAGHIDIRRPLVRDASLVRQR